MKFIVDAQLPRTLVAFLRDHRFDAIHTKDLPNGNDTTDAQINAISIAESRIVISKDGDFYDSFASKKEIYKLTHFKAGRLARKAERVVFEEFNSNSERT